MSLLSIFVKQKQERCVHLRYKAAAVHFRGRHELVSGVVSKPPESSDMAMPRVVLYRMILYKRSIPVST